MNQKRARRTRAELREMMITAGQEVLYQIEPSLGFEELSYSAVFAHLLDHHDQKVTIGSVHERLWPNQRAFQLEVLSTVITSAIGPITNDTAERNASILRELAGTSVASRRYALQTAVRLSSERLGNERPDSHATAVMQTVRFRMWALGEDHPEALEFIEPLIAIRDATTDAYVKVVEAAMGALNLRVRADAGDPEEAIRAVAILGNAATVGLRADVLPETKQPRQMPTGPAGELEDWYPDAIAIWALVCNTVEFADDGLSAGERRV